MFTARGSCRASLWRALRLPTRHAARARRGGRSTGLAGLSFRLVAFPRSLHSPRPATVVLTRAAAEEALDLGERRRDRFVELRDVGAARLGHVGASAARAADDLRDALHENTCFEPLGRAL